MGPSLSIKEEIDTKFILITGVVGFLGPVCLEQLLRLTGVSASAAPPGEMVHQILKTNTIIEI